MTVLPGVENLIINHLDAVEGKKIGVISSASGVTRNLTHSVDALLAAGVEVAALFGPEHGLYAAAPDGETIEQIVDARTGLPVYSLYGQQYKPTGDMLAGLDALLFDIQAAGVRFYTYIATLLHIMQAAAEHSLPVIICDRPNPITGELVEGPLLQPGFESFVGPGPLPIRHGLTMGELGRLYQKFWGVDCEITIIPCQGWQRSMWFDQTGLHWVPASPGIPKMETMLVYPGTCIIEGTNLSEGRGYTTPFEVVGAPWIDAWQLASTLNALDLSGVIFRPAHFQPTSNKWADQPCAGVQLHVTDRRVFRPVTAGLHLVDTVRRLYPTDFAWREAHFDRLLGSDQIRLQLEANIPVVEIMAGWADDRAAFEAQRQQVMLYTT